MVLLPLIKALQEKADHEDEKSAIWEHYFKEYKTPKKRYDALTQPSVADHLNNR